MRAAALLVLLGASLASAQRPGPTWWLPDSLSGIVTPVAATWSPADNRVYVGDWDGNYLLAIDAATSRRVARFDLGSPVVAICANPRSGLLYLLDDDEMQLRAFDPASGRVIDSFPAGRADLPGFVCSPASNRLYAYDEDNEALVSLDAATLALRARFDTLIWPFAGCHDPLRDRAYFAGCSWRDNTALLVGIDCATDSITMSVEFCTGSELVALCVDTTGNRLFTAYWDRDADSGWCCVIDGSTGTVTGRIALDWEWLACCYNEQTDRVFGLDDDQLVVVDPTAGRVVDRFLVTAAAEPLLCVNPADNLVYVLTEGDENDGMVAVFDGDGRHRVAEVPLAGLPSALCWVPSAGRAFVASENSAIDVIAGDSLVESIRTAWWLYSQCLVAARNRLYVAVAEPRRIIAIDTRTGDWALVADSTTARFIQPAPDSSHLYCAASDGTIAVIDVAANAVTARFAIAGNPRTAAVAPGSNRIYCLTSGSPDRVYAIDCAQRRPVDSFPVSANPTALDYDPMTGRLWCAGDSGVIGYEALSGARAAHCPLRRAGPVHAAPELRRYYAYTTGRDSLVTVDLDSARVVGSVHLGGSPHFALSAADRRLFCVEERADRVYVLDALTGVMLDSADAPWSVKSITRNEARDRLLVFGSAGRTAAFDWRTMRFGPTFLLPDDPRQITVAPDGVATFALSTHFGITVIEESAPVTAPGVAANQVLAGRWLAHCGPGCTPLHDAGGRQVLMLRPGGNDISRLGPGVYFVAPDGATPARKVIIVR